MLKSIHNTFSLITRGHTGSSIIPANPDAVPTPRRPHSISSKPRPSQSKTLSKVKRSHEAPEIRSVMPNEVDPFNCNDLNRHFEDDKFSDHTDKSASDDSFSGIDLLEDSSRVSEASTEKGKKTPVRAMERPERPDPMTPLVERKRKDRPEGKQHGRGQSALVRQSSIRMVQKIKERCALCKEPMTEDDYEQLACTHRYHPGCAYKMRERNRYSCDLCENLKARMCSIMLLKGRRGRPEIMNGE